MPKTKDPPLEHEKHLDVRHMMSQIAALYGTECKLVVMGHNRGRTGWQRANRCYRDSKINFRGIDT